MLKSQLTYLLLLLLLLIAGNRTEAQQRIPATRFTFHGLDRLDERALRDALDERAAQRMLLSDESGLRLALLDAAAAQGFPFSRIDSIQWRWTEDSSTVTASIHFAEGPLLRTGRITFTGNAGISAETLARERDLTPGTVFTDAALNADLRRIVAAYDAAGYPFAEARLEDLALREEDGDARADITIAITEGPLFFIDEITVEGNAQTDADVIIRETRIGEHERYDPENVADIRRRLERLQFFSRVDEPQLYLRDSTGGLLLRVAEGNTNQFDGVVGYQPPRGEEQSGSFTGLVNMSFRNLFGTGRRLDARWERATSEISELAIHYLEPWVAGLPVNVAGGLFQRQQDSAYVRRSFDGAVSFLWNSDVQLTGKVEQTQVIPSEGSQVAGLARSTTLTGGLELRIDTRDNVYNPRSGITLRNSYSSGNKRIRLAAGDVTAFVQRLEVDAEYFLELFSRTVFAAGLHGRELRGGELDLSDLYRLGGANTLRGYREEQFSGTRLGWTSVELRYSLGRRTFAFAFFDFGYIEQSPDPTRNRPAFSALRRGYGIGGRLETGLGIIGVSYALGEGDGLAEGKIHFGLINAF
ncbi:MAG: BamA/TamA family outer membrane protein [Bacteroidetes bacterium]|nr:BamA/TamA family outer membrane protein [Bacteroidota bacterium]